MVLIIIVTICLFITLWFFTGCSYSDGISIKELIFGEDDSDYIEFKNNTLHKLHEIEQERELDYEMLKETRDDVKKIKSQLYIAETECKEYTE